MKRKMSTGAVGEAIRDLTDNGAIKGFKILTQVEYDAIVTKDPQIVYLIRG